MDPHLHWLRRRIARSVLQRLALAWLAWSALALALIEWRSDASLTSTLAWAVLAGQAAAVAQTAIARRTSSFSPAYLRRYLSATASYVPAPDAPGELHPAVAELERYNLRRIAMHDPSVDPAPVFDVLQTPDRMITVAVGRDAGSVAFLTATEDRRILYTSDLAIPPTEETIVNWVPGGGVDELALAHRKLVAELQLRRVEAVECGPHIFSELMALERDAYELLGTVLAPFFDVGGTRSPLGLRHAPKPEELRELTARGAVDVESADAADAVAVR